MPKAFMTERNMPKVSIIMPARIRNADEVQWMHEAVDSVLAQTVKDWQLVIVSDHSDTWPDLPTDKRIDVYRGKAHSDGTAATRNLAAELAESDLLLPLDADDRLAPFAIEKFLGAWKGEGFIYSSTMMFGLDWTRLYHAPEYSFYELLKKLPCVVGSLHLKSDWAKVGGWKSALDGGLEDWEYWIALGEMGVCGAPIQDVCYWYRRTANGRLTNLLKERGDNYKLAYSKMRDLHLDVFNGRFPMGRCGGKRAAVVDPRSGITMADYQSPAGAVMVQYIGRRAGSFGVRGNRTGTRYTVPGIGKLIVQPNGAAGVAPEDVPFILSLGRGADFRVYDPPK
jgi:glycosyltransferase involved in cell wall biosynthesis